MKSNVIPQLSTRTKEFVNSGDWILSKGEVALDSNIEYRLLTEKSMFFLDKAGKVVQRLNKSATTDFLEKNTIKFSDVSYKYVGYPKPNRQLRIGNSVITFNIK